jgi:NAD(P)-dependent dehydrogenase (short-subunit alcohol dehydrogenase family)
MRELRGKVAVVTGAASGIGRSMARRFAAEGMKVVLADIEADALEQAQAAMVAEGATALAVVTDVSSGASVEALAAKTLEAFGAVHVICNNAGVGGIAAPLWTLTEADWDWTLRVNLWGVIHGLRVFVPILLAQGGEGHVVNTASAAGLTATPFMAAYAATKHAVVAISEVLSKDLQIADSTVKVSVLCPGFVRTRIVDSGRNRPADLCNPAKEPSGSGAVTMGQAVRQMVDAGMAPDEVADQVVAAIRDERFYILPHPEVKAVVQQRMDDIFGERTPEVGAMFKALR